MKLGLGRLLNWAATAVRVLTAGALVAVLVYGGVSLHRIHKAQDEALERTVFLHFRHTEQRLEALAKAVQWRAGFDEAPVPTDVDGLVAWLFAEEIEGWEGSEVLNQCGPGLNKSGSYHDHWDRSIKIMAAGDHNYLLVSFGADGTDNNGKRDDVVHRFDPLIDRPASPNGAEEN